MRFLKWLLSGGTIQRYCIFEPCNGKVFGKRIWTEHPAYRLTSFNQPTIEVDRFHATWFDRLVLVVWWNFPSKRTVWFLAGRINKM
jgi:hypothetical protein